MAIRFAKRMETTPASYIMELISICQDPEVISFASGLPDAELIDVEGIRDATCALLDEGGRDALQYSITEGYLPLREYIADRYRRRHSLNLDAEDMVIVNGSQQCFDLMGKVTLDPGSPMVMEAPAYIGAVQGFSIFQPRFIGVPLNEDGPDMDAMADAMSGSPRLVYSVPNFQNPMGSTYSLDSRRRVADMLVDADTVMLEDDAYGELGFEGDDLPPIARMAPDNVVLTGSFSKVFSPGMRCGWMAGPKDVMDVAKVAKEAADLHSNFFCQRVIHRWLEDNDLDAHIARISREYRARRDLMTSLMDDLMPQVQRTSPKGGLFVWITLPEGMSIWDVYTEALKRKVAIMPGPPSFPDGGGERSARLNFSNSDEERIERGMQILAEVIRDLSH